MKSRVKKPKEVPRFYTAVAKFFQSIAYVCLFVGTLALLGVITYAIVTYWPQADLGGSGSSPVDYGSDSGGGWIWLTIRMTVGSGYAVIVGIVFGILAILLIIWGLRLMVRTARRLTWRLADEIMKPLSLVEPILLLTVWALTILGTWLSLDDKSFLAAGFACLIFLGLGLVSFLAMRRLAGNSLDYTRAELVWRR
jgi:hypothetical protein